MAKPPSALVKLVESVGILLDVPVTHSKSKYKAPSPSNYDGTMDRLVAEFPQLVSKLGSMDSSDVTNAVASRLFSKTIEVGYDYEEAVAAGGLEARDLFNSITLIMSMLQEQQHRIPIKKMNLLVLVDGSRPSYVTLDTAAHLHKHGICTVTAVLAPDSTSNPDVLMYHHLPADLQRRCQEQYHMPEQSFKVDVMMAAPASDPSDLQDDIRSKMDHINSNILVMGIDKNFSGTDTLSPIAQWAAWEPGYITALVKSSSRLRPFASNVMPRTFQCCLKGLEDADQLFGVCLTLMSPGDHVVFCCVVDSGEPRGDSQQTRFSMGARQRWVAGAVPPAAPTNRVDWNDGILEELNKRIEELTARSQISGKPVLYKHDPLRTVAQELCAVAYEEGADMMVLRRGVDREVSKEVLADSTCTVVLCD
jgi:nucleotide-binding universal stress UspA family protein